jgi:hypothetical protein
MYGLNSRRSIQLDVYGLNTDNSDTSFIKNPNLFFVDRYKFILASNLILG